MWHLFCRWSAARSLLMAEYQKMTLESDCGLTWVFQLVINMPRSEKWLAFTRTGLSVWTELSWVCFCPQYILSLKNNEVVTLRWNCQVLIKISMDGVTLFADNRCFFSLSLSLSSTHSPCNALAAPTMCHWCRYDKRLLISLHTAVILNLVIWLCTDFCFIAIFPNQTKLLPT